MEFSIKEVVMLFKKRLLIIVLCTAAGLGCLFIINQYVIQPSYTASVQLYVNPNEVSSSANLNELYYAQKVVTTYISFLKTKVFYKRVLEEAQLGFTQKQLEDMTKIVTVNNTEIFKVSVTAYSPKDAYLLATAMQKVAPELIQDIKNSAKISVVDPVTYPAEPSGPNIVLNTIAGGLLGFLLSVVLVILWEIIDVNVKDKDDLIYRYHRPILGSIPSYGSNHIKKFSFLLSRLPFRKKNKERKENVINENTKFIITEAYKELRINLRYTIYKDGCRKILINSPIPEDGKSTTCANIGITLAQTGVRVLLMDCDLRKGKLHSFFHIKSRSGISEVLSGILTERDVIQNTNYPNLQVITVGAIPPNPTELLASSQMDELLKRLEKNYDYIIIDSPPVNVVSDALSLVKLVDGVIIVVRENGTSHPNISGAISKYEFVGAHILGFVINAITLSRGRKNKSQYYYYNKHD